ncbi:GGDEF domain-containing protein [Vibrio sp. TH_r3]|uniref:GGDEF domain-containing protein n=1 Tax=Vibrio sp. TH_r3 TaxID=3082084 RepID=UPI002954CB23|nr:GGDEF domain-containing protein [Vibrio sp. TH_r3]MDV7105532.1 GGDEF domain-containing protein [Vibrio sp. TH_r3]
MNTYSYSRERTLIVRFFSTIGFIATFAMACVAMSNADIVLGILLLVSAGLYAWAFLYSAVEKSATTILYNLYCLMLYLVITGGVEGTGPIWIFIVSPVAYSIRGLKKGTIDIVVFLFVVIAGFIITDNYNIYDYQPEALPLRVVISFIIVALLTGFYERLREKYNEEIVALSQKNERLATIDFVTDLPNRRFMMKELVELKHRHKKTKQPYVILLADVDNFKKINDNYGHDLGDEALTQLANILKKSMPTQGIASRWGGEEFLIALPNSDKALGQSIAEKIHAELQKTTIYMNGKSVALTLSIGLVQSQLDKTIAQDIKLADERLYKAKEQGKNRTCS